MLLYYRMSTFAGFTSLCQIYAKSQNVIAKNGCPRAFIRCIADLETYIKEVNVIFFKFFVACVNFCKLLDF